MKLFGGFKPSNFAELESQFSNVVPVPESDISNCKHEFIEKHISEIGLPLVFRNIIKDWNDKSCFTLEALKSQTNDLHIAPKSTKHESIVETMTLSDLISNYDQLFQKFQSAIYLDSIPAPQNWLESIQQSLADISPYGTNDLISLMKEKDRPINHGLHVGKEGSYTTAHREVSSTLLHSLMMNGSSDSSSLWIILSPNDSKQIGSVEGKLFELDELATKSINVCAVFQYPGDLVIVPPDSYYQVIDYGDMAIKFNWNRATISSLNSAFKHFIDIDRMSNRNQESTFIGSRPITLPLKYILYKKSKLIVSRYKSHQIEQANSSLLLGETHLLSLCFRMIEEEDYGIESSSIEYFQTRPGACDFCGAPIFWNFCRPNLESYCCLQCISDGTVNTLNYQKIQCCQHVMREKMMNLKKNIYEILNTASFAIPPTDSNRLFGNRVASMLISNLQKNISRAEKHSQLDLATTYSKAAGGIQSPDSSLITNSNTDMAYNRASRADLDNISLDALEMEAIQSLNGEVGMSDSETKLEQQTLENTTVQSVTQIDNNEEQDSLPAHITLPVIAPHLASDIAPPSCLSISEQLEDTSVLFSSLRSHISNRLTIGQARKMEESNRHRCFVPLSSQFLVQNLFASSALTALNNPEDQAHYSGLSAFKTTSFNPICAMPASFLVSPDTESLSEREASLFGITNNKYQVACNAVPLIDSLSNVDQQKEGIIIDWASIRSDNVTDNAGDTASSMMMLDSIANSELNTPESSIPLDKKKRKRYEIITSDDDIIIEPEKKKLKPGKKSGMKGKRGPYAKSLERAAKNQPEPVVASDKMTDDSDVADLLAFFKASGPPSLASSATVPYSVDSALSSPSNTGRKASRRSAASMDASSPATTKSRSKKDAPISDFDIPNAWTGEIIFVKQLNWPWWPALVIRKDFVGTKRNAWGPKRPKDAIFPIFNLHDMTAGGQSWVCDLSKIRCFKPMNIPAFTTLPPLFDPLLLHSEEARAHFTRAIAAARHHLQQVEEGAVEYLPELPESVTSAANPPDPIYSVVPVT